MIPAHKQRGYLVAIFASILIMLLRAALHSALGEQAIFLPFVLSVMAGAWIGGFGPGLLATGLGLLSGVYFFVPPTFSFQIDSFAQELNAVVFLIVGTTISALCEALHTAQQRDTERQFRTLADSIPQLVWMAHPDGSRFWFNQRWYEYTGTTPEQMMGWGWLSVYEPAERRKVQNSWQAAIAKGRPWEQILALRRHDGQLFWYLVRAVPLYNRHGKITTWFGTNTDISERLEIENALRDADRHKNEFLATLAHELRNPLAALDHALDLWSLTENDNKSMEELRATMGRQVERMSRLIEELLDVTRISHGKICLVTKQVELKQVLLGAVESVRPIVDSRHLQLAVKLPAELLKINGDADRLTQVFINLLHNAAKFSGDEGYIWLDAKRTGTCAVVTVRDNGCGISCEMLHKVFEPLWQAGRTHDRTQDGLGLGLFLAKQLVELHGGTIEARSDGAGMGAEFIVSLPVITESESTTLNRTIHNV